MIYKAELDFCHFLKRRMEDGTITLVTKIQQQDIEINTLWDQLIKISDVNDVLIDFIRRKGLLNELKHEIIIKIGDTLTYDNKEENSLYNHVYERIKKLN